jgi:hypothetical protein
MHLLSAGTLVWNVMETTQKNEVIVYLLCSINYEIKNIYYLRFSFDSPTYTVDVPQAAPALHRWSRCSCCFARNDALTPCAVICHLKQNPLASPARFYHIYCIVLFSTTLPMPVSSHYFPHTSSNFRAVLSLPPSLFFLFLSISVFMSNYRLFHLCLPFATSSRASSHLR